MSAIQIIYRRLLPLLVITACVARAQSHRGFDKNEYPGDAALSPLRKSFAWTGYWLNTPPGAQSNTWQGKRAPLARAGFGFALLFNGKLSAQLPAQQAAAAGTSDALLAVTSARKEGFLAPSVLFLDIEEGGRLLSTQKAYLFAWADAVRRSGFKAGVYCSGISVPDGVGKTITTAQDIQQSEGARHLPLWVAQDACPPSPGCVAGATLSPAQSGTSQAAIWQYSQSPRRAQFTAACAQTYAPDGSCYAPGTNTFVDFNVARHWRPTTASRGRRRTSR